MTRRAVEETAAFLTRHGRDALPYHAGLAPEIRARNQERFLREEGVIVVATVAFGMGIDKPNVRFVAHLDAPKNLEAYYQETGRAGRDGLPADAWMAYGIADVMNLRRLIEASDIDERQRRIERQKTEALIGFCETVGLPPSGIARLFRRARPAALRQLRQLPGPARKLGRHRRRAEGLVGRLPHRRAFRRAPPRRRAGRQPDRARRPLRPRPDQDLRRRHRARRARLAVGDPPACRARPPVARSRKAMAACMLGAERPRGTARRDPDPLPHREAARAAPQIRPRRKTGRQNPPRPSTREPTRYGRPCAPGAWRKPAASKSRPT